MVANRGHPMLDRCLILVYVVEWGDLWHCGKPTMRTRLVHRRVPFLLSALCSCMCASFAHSSLWIARP